MNWKYSIQQMRPVSHFFRAKLTTPCHVKLLHPSSFRNPALAQPVKPHCYQSTHRQQPLHNGGKRGCKHASNPAEAGSVTRREFWASRPTWHRAALNTLRCLVGCTAGDFAAMWTLQTYAPDLGMGTIMGIAMVSGISTSMALETVLLRLGRDRLAWAVAVKTAAGMSLISMLTMEMAENAVDYYLTGGAVAFDSPKFWLAAAVSMAAGFLAPLPYNYVRLRRFGKACH